MLWVAGGNPRPPALSDNPAAPPAPHLSKDDWNLYPQIFVGTL